MVTASPSVTSSFLSTQTAKMVGRRGKCCAVRKQRERTVTLTESPLGVRYFPQMTFLNHYNDF